MFTSTSAFSAALVSVSIEESLGKIIDVNSVTDVELFPSKKGREALDFVFLGFEYLPLTSIMLPFGW